jgi:hypothetical protein
VDASSRAHLPMLHGDGNCAHSLDRVIGDTTNQCSRTAIAADDNDNDTADDDTDDDDDDKRKR